MHAPTGEPRAFATEIKFVVTAPVAQGIRDWARSHLSGDPNGGGPFGDDYRTTSLYFDTDQFDVFHRRGSYGRAKYRIRRYGDDPAVYLERKMKTRGYLHKRRSVVRIDALDQLNIATPVAHDWNGYWFHRRLMRRRLHPVCEITYARTARMALTNDGPVRLTIDEAVQARTAEGLRFSMAPGVPTLDRQCVVELKYERTPPALLKRLVEEFALQPKAMSKYRAAVEALGLTTAFHA
jgi:hypothetical protein